MKKVIRLGDPTSHGGSVVSAAPNFSIMDVQVARIGDHCTNIAENVVYVHTGRIIRHQHAVM